MNFKENKPIFQQIADRLCEEILQGRYAEETRIPGVRDYASTVEVNVNTIMRSYDYLQSRNIIQNRRGLGYFVSAGAVQLIYSMRRDEFLQESLPSFFHQLRLLRIPMSEIEALYADYARRYEEQNALSANQDADTGNTNDQ